MDELKAKLALATITYLAAALMSARFGETTWTAYFLRCAATMGLATLVVAIASKNPELLCN